MAARPAEHNETLKPGSTISRYRILRKLSAGGFGVVYLAKREDGVLVAIKEFMPSVVVCRKAEYRGRIKFANASDERRFQEGLEAFFREADMLAKIHDDRVIAIWDVFRTNGTAYFAMPVEKGVTLQQALKNRRDIVEANTARRWMIEACKGVEVLHANGLLHLDIKPGNLWLRPDGKVVVLDLGASRWEDEEGRTRQLARTPGFAAPEQHGKVDVKALTVRTDVYGLCASIYAILEGCPPTSAPLRKATDGSWAKMRCLAHPYKFLRLIERGLSLAPEQRWASVKELRQELEKLPRMDELKYGEEGGLGSPLPWGRDEPWSTSWRES